MSGEAFVDTREEERKEKVKQVCREMLRAIRDFDPKKLAGSPLQRQIDAILANPAIDFTNYKILSKDALLGKFMGHDLDNTANNVLLNREVTRENESENEKRRSVGVILKYWPHYSSIMEDICLRGLDNRKIDKEHLREFNFATFSELLAGFKGNMREKMFAKSSETASLVSNRLDISKKLKELTFLNSVDPAKIAGEKCCVVPGVVINALYNIVRNAAGEYLKMDAEGKIILDESGVPTELGAERVNVSVYKEGKFIVFRVVDNGKGMTPDYLEEGAPKNIFAEGRSHRGSSGYGLTNMPQRLKSMGAHLRVLTWQRDNPSAPSALFDSMETDIGGSDSVEKPARGAKEWVDLMWKERVKVAQQVGFAPSTIFEIRIPIINEK